MDGIGRFHWRSIVVIGRETAPTPEPHQRHFGVRAARRATARPAPHDLADQFDLPVLTLVDTPAPTPASTPRSAARPRRSRAPPTAACRSGSMVAVVTGRGGPRRRHRHRHHQDRADPEHSIYSVISPEAPLHPVARRSAGHERRHQHEDHHQDVRDPGRHRRGHRRSPSAGHAATRPWYSAPQPRQWPGPSPALRPRPGHHAPPAPRQVSREISRNL